MPEFPNDIPDQLSAAIQKPMESQLDHDNKHRYLWMDILALIFSFFGVAVSMGGAYAIYGSQLEFGHQNLWPLPGLVLAYWAILGLICFVVCFLSTRMEPALFIYALWFISGAFIPLIVLGAFSIGMLVLIAFLLFAISTLLLSIRRKSNWLNSLGMFLLGAIFSLGILLLTLTLAKSNY